MVHCVNHNVTSWNLAMPLFISSHSHFIFVSSCDTTGGCRAHLWRQPGTSAPSQASQRRKTQASGERIKTVNSENVHKELSQQDWNKYFL